ncbi:MAG: glycosyltransferase family 4 protein [Gammaproteobacteria bacterium]|nr:glycosyltransferase family 4 protein [Gammaproteobacteria bacterium]MBU1557295.1 glycosyltransferase family 4 protein [Gammaproteobacteria bacterium]MBU2071246.1 glycosyltransferase family 4 protein [Gammaproteobacteria bacterium]MBU2181653.1 glycosyltransferase family 4 protein [Gammaproteobacteria bacterium]MBU2205359.1 glycosyltransferase family 4 protein [Gammaproteobacteria bacterium]
MLSLLQLFLQQGWQVVFASVAEPGPHRYPLAELGILEQRIELNNSSFEHWLSAQAPSAVMFDRFMLEEQFGWRVEQACPQALRILDMEDCHALRDARQRCFNADKAVDAQALNSELALREIAAIYRCDLTLVISDYEMQLLQQHYQVPAALLCYCPFLIDANLTSPLPDYTTRRDFIAIGNFRHAPNWHSVLWLKQQIWPLIRQQLPQAELHIYGAYPPPKATALHNEREGFLLKGWAEDALVVMQQARVCLAPLAFGAGLKGKLLDAMRCGTPNVTTETGAEGMTLNGEWGGLIAKDSQGIAETAVAIYQQPELWQRLQITGFKIVQEKFAHTQHSARIWLQLSQVQQALDNHRQANFTGLMLRHHAYRSTKFMGQWIEAKTRLAEQSSQTRVD